jgi:hypothetical protein
MRPIQRIVAATIVALTLAGAAATASASTATPDAGNSPSAQAGQTDRSDRSRGDRVTVYGLTTTGRIVTFSLDRPDRAHRTVSVRGLARGETLVGIDRRPLDNQLYGLARSNKGARLYTIDPSTGRARALASLVTAPTATSANRTPVRLDGYDFGVDFNPAADAFRIVSDTGQNLRVIPSARTAPDGTALLPGDTFVDGALTRDGAPAMGVTGAAYTNNDNDPATATTLYDIDSWRDELVVQNPPNAGTLVTPLPLERRTLPLVGFDIRTTPGQGDLAVASLTKGWGMWTTSSLFVVDLTTGELDRQGAFRWGGLRDIALAG